MYVFGVILILNEESVTLRADLCNRECKWQFWRQCLSHGNNAAESENLEFHALGILRPLVS
jgi:hypothetical protein